MFPRRYAPVSVRVIALLFVSALSSHILSGQVAPVPQNRPHDVHPIAQADQEQFIPYWTTETGWRSELQLRNNMAVGDLAVTPALRMPNGTEIPLSPVTIKPREIKILDLESAVIGSAPQYVGTYGSVVLRYHSSGLANLFAMLMIHNIGHSVAFHIDARGEDQDPQSGSREGIWWLPNDTATDHLVLSNQSSAAVELELSLFDSTGREAKQKIALAAGATNRLSVRQLVISAGLSGAFGGIKVFAPVHAGSLDSVHLLFDEKASFSALFKMFDHNPGTTLEERDFAHTKVWTLRAPMLALWHPDPALAFPEGTVLRPQFFVRNVLPKPVDVNVRFNWRGSGPTSGKAVGPSFRLGAYETKRIDVAALQAVNVLPQDANWASVILTTNGLPDEVMAIAASYDQTLRYGAQTAFSDQLAFHWVGSLWEYDAQHNSLITTGNGGTKPLEAAFTIYYNQGTQKYELDQSLQPDEQMWIDVGKLIRERVPDKNGNVLPADLASGSYEIRDLTNKGVGNLFEGKVVYDKTYGHVTYGCGGCCGYTQVKFWYNPLGIPLQSTTPNGVDGWTTCTASWEDVSGAFYGSWSTANSGIATVDYYANHTGVAIGSTTSATFGYMEHSSARNSTCPITKFVPLGATDNVNAPDHLKILNDIYQASSACPTTKRRLITYQEVAVNNAPVGTVQSKEQFAGFSTNTCRNGTPSTSSTCSADTNGVFTDELTINCNSVGGSCGLTATKQQWLWCPPNGAAVVIATPGDIILHNDEVSVGGNTGGFVAGTCIYASGLIVNPCI